MKDSCNITKIHTADGSNYIQLNIYFHHQADHSK